MTVLTDPNMLVTGQIWDQVHHRGATSLAADPAMIPWEGRKSVLAPSLSVIPNRVCQYALLPSIGRKARSGAMSPPP
jgi:hypothetical protein